LIPLERYEDAFDVLEHTLSFAERQFESDRSNRAFLVQCLVSTGGLECKIGNLAKAELHLQRALDYIGESPGGSDRVSCTQNLVEMLERQGKHQEAEKLCYQLLEFCTKKYGIHHRYRLESSRVLAELMQRAGRLDEASELLQQGLEAVEPRTVFDLCEVQTNIDALEHILRLQGKVREVAHLFQQAMEEFVNVLGEEHPLTLMAAEKFATMLSELDERDHAIRVMKSCAMISRRVVGPDYKQTNRRARYVTKWEQELKDAETRATQRMHDAQKRREALTERTSRGKREDYCTVQ
jgi:tetratricopeptide (TPR) repeat protein